MNTQIEITPVFAGDGSVRLDIYGRDLPDNFLGVSFYLDVQSDLGWSLGNFEKGSVFGSNEPLLLVKEKNDNEQIIAGITLKRTEKIELSQGTILSIYLKPESAGEFSVNFSKAVFSVYENGRKDIPDVVWKGTDFVFGENMVTQIDVAADDEIGVDAEIEHAEIEPAEIRTSILSVGDEVVPITKNDTSLSNVYWFMLILFVILLGVTGVFVIMKKRITIKRD